MRTDGGALFAGREHTPTCRKHSRQAVIRSGALPKGLP